jgi:lipid-binding SYLF domain-containing protein
MKNKILVYSRTKGLFAGINLSGAAVKPDDDSTQGYYGKLVPPSQVLTGKGPSNTNSKLFLADVRQAFRESNTNQKSPSGD